MKNKKVHIKGCHILEALVKWTNTWIVYNDVIRQPSANSPSEGNVAASK